MQFIEFVEALSRVAERVMIPPEDEIRQSVIDRAQAPILE